MCPAVTFFNGFISGWIAVCLGDLDKLFFICWAMMPQGSIQVEDNCGDFIDIDQVYPPINDISTLGRSVVFSERIWE